jgi:hypothetical protein
MAGRRWARRGPICAQSASVDTGAGSGTGSGNVIPVRQTDVGSRRKGDAPFNITDDAVAQVTAAFRQTVRELCVVIDDLKRELKEKRS